MPSQPPSDAVPTSVVLAGMAAAAAIDLKTRRIPNALTASLALAGFGLAALGLGRVSLGAALFGCLLGLLFMLPGHFFGATGAGDVKLLASAGALLGPADTAYAFVYTAIAGGLLALAVSLHRRQFQRTLSSTAALVARREGAAAAAESPVVNNRFAYAPAIAIGVALVALGW